MQKAGDRQKTLAKHGELLSDQRLPFEVINWLRVASVEGRVLAHGEDEHFGKRFMMLEATSAKVYYIPYTEDMEEFRSRGGLRTNSFIRLRRSDRKGIRVEVEDFGHSESVLANRHLLREKVNDWRMGRVDGSEDIKKRYAPLRKTTQSSRRTNRLTMNHHPRE
jgi:hypothetical protein